MNFRASMKSEIKFALKCYVSNLPFKVPGSQYSGTKLLKQLKVLLCTAFDLAYFNTKTRCQQCGLEGSKGITNTITLIA